VVEHRVAEHEVERAVGERQLGGVAGDRVDVEAEALGVARQRLQHAGGDVRAGGGAHDAGLHQVEREVAGPGADLERVRERPGSRAEQLLDLAQHLRAPLRAERDAPLAVVLGGRRVVVATVEVEDLLGGVGRGHGAASLGGRYDERRDRTPRGARSEWRVTRLSAEQLATR
jgi:hypothetical protein